MKRMAYSGTYKIQPGDFLVFDGDTDSVITERELKDEQKKIPIVSVPWIHRKIQWSFNKKELLEEQKMSNYFMLDGKKIPMSDETAKSLQKKQTYSIGDCFKVGAEDTIVMLAICGSNPTKVIPVCLDDGNWWSVSKIVKDTHAITPMELHSLLDNFNHEYTLITLRIEEN